MMLALPPTPAGLQHPPAIWVFNIVIPLLGIILLGRFSCRSVQQKRLTWWWLFFIAAALCWWLETFGDWGQYLVYSPRLWHYHLSLSHTSPVNPYFMPWAYGLYWGVHAVLVLRLAAWLQRRTGWRRGTGVLLFAAPVGYAWDIVVETIATHFGWWSYQTPIGPYFHSGRGLQPLVVPIVVMFTWPNLMAWLVGDPRDDGPNLIERLFHVDRLQAATTDGTPGAWQPRYELARIGSWVVVFWVSFVLLLDVPLIILRETIGHPSIFVP